ncbi:MAG: Substrate-specific component ThiT of thiamine ECF transporter [Candidatus Ozemobacter sibiricus]|uniref:Substrate-specific component ThiT of thiamine ECF transporter n=1 Tax=Candidatus Ozemobacter sibiricus TaxID=2268124 RepID=A0A367ZRL7_9BACT|nr:MAG: Substrate-specific component ThiT of thiamine ECF transporter [Candidatus Ozemobacter sibiricus]
MLAESGMMLAVSLALAQVKLFQLPSGGSVSLGFWPVMILAARRGWRVGVTTGALLGVLSAVLKPFVVHPVQCVLDYPLAFASLGLAGVWVWATPTRAAVASLVANLARLACHVVAGAVFFTGGNPAAVTWMGALGVGLGYNLLHVGPEALLGVILSAMLTRQHPALVSRQD